MASVPVSDYEAEIRDYLVGRLARNRTGGPSRSRETAIPTRRLLDWWIFEGKRYRSLQRHLAFEWFSIEHQTRRLMASHSPHWRPLESPEGEVDWLATAHHSATSGQPEYVCRTSQLGLTREEASALTGWRGWIASRWTQYTDLLGLPDGAPKEVPWARGQEEAEDDRQLKRWAFIARRSRWPLLRSVVAESLRAVFEPQVVDLLPLPGDVPTLFELVCLVRVLRVLSPEPRAIRWLDLEDNQNTIRIPGVTCYFQRSIPREEMLATSEFGGGLREALLRHDVAVPTRMDGLFVFDQPWGGFQGILIEAKSGSQDPSTTIFQLKCYRAALRGWLPGPLVICGVVENEAGVFGSKDLGPVNGEAQDVWVFSSADAIESTVQRLIFAAE